MSRPLWSDDQVARLNAFQKARVMHPFTCPAAHDGERDLVATPDGWRCPSCDYTQNWAHSFMLGWPLPGEPPVVTNDLAIRDPKQPHHPTDDELLSRAATTVGVERFIPGTPPADHEIGLRGALADLSESYAAQDREHAAILARLSEDEKIAVVAWAMRTLIEHARQGGTFRYLIYTRMGFSVEAYAPLCRAGGVEISNYFTMPPEPGGVP